MDTLASVQGACEGAGLLLQHPLLAPLQQAFDDTGPSPGIIGRSAISRSPSASSQGDLAANGAATSASRCRELRPVTVATTVARKG